MKNEYENLLILGGLIEIDPLAYISGLIIGA